MDGRVAALFEPFPIKRTAMNVTRTPLNCARGHIYFHAGSTMAGMSQANLTHIEAQFRAEALTLSAYHLHLDISQAANHEEKAYPVTSRIEFRTTEPELFIDYLGADVTALTINNEPADVDFRDGRIYLHDLPINEDLTVEIAGLSSYSRSGQGLHRMHDTADGKSYLYSHLEPSDARRIFPCFEQPDLKARFHVKLSAPAEWEILSNQPEISRKISSATSSDSGEVAEVATVEFAETPLLSTYLTSFAAGPYASKKQTWTAPDESLTVELRSLARASMADFLDDEILELTAQGMDFFHENFDFPYPWGKYDSIFVPEYNLGAMENPGLVTFTESYLFRSAPTRSQHAARTNTILHEMSHMWFGDLVTPQWWDDLWLKESFAEYMGADSSVHSTQYVEAWTNFAGSRKNWAYAQDQLPTTHPIKAEIPDVDAARQNFDGITYAKGAAVLKQLVHYVGRDEFYSGARDYFKAHAFAAATFDDLLDSLRNHTDRDLDTWSDAWLKTSGPDTLTPEITVTDDAIESLGIAATAEGATRPHRVSISLFDASLTRTDTFDVDIAAGSSTTTIAEAQGKPAPSLILINDGDHTYAKVRFDDTSLESLRGRLSELRGGAEEELSRAVIWTALWNMTRDGKWAATEFIDTVLQHAPAEDNTNLMGTNFANARFAVKNFLAEEHRDDKRAEVAAKFWELLTEAEAGSDAQLTIARSAIATLAATPEDSGTQRLKDILDGHIEGLELSPDIRWSTIQALAARDAVSEEVLEEQRHRDNTLTGAAEYLGAKYSYPTAENKRYIFDQVRIPQAYSNAEVMQLLAAFGAPGSSELTDGFAEEFFEVLDTIWAEHPIEIANHIVRGLFPNQEMALGATDKFLSQGEVPGALRRVLLECQDNVRRNLMVQNAQ